MLSFSEYDAADEEELQRLVEEEFSLRLEEEELLAIGEFGPHWSLRDMITVCKILGATLLAHLIDDRERGEDVWLKHHVVLVYVLCCNAYKFSGVVVGPLL